MEDILRETTHRQRTAIAKILHEPLSHLARQCVSAWSDRERLNEVLVAGFVSIPHCTHLFVLNSAGIQVSDKVGSDGPVTGSFGRDCSNRPYMREAVPAWGFLLSDAYISMPSRHPSLTALHVLYSGEQLLGYLAADFDLRDLPMTAKLYAEPSHWRQIKGDPSIRQLLFQQHRVESLMDRNIQHAMSILEELLTQRGMFQGVIHFSSSRATIWTIEDPYRYRMLDHESLTDPDICLAYPRRQYPPDAKIPRSSIAPVLNTMKELRAADETIYLRSASINLFNGMVSLTFSCDGTHYMPYDEFLEKSLSFWFGNVA
jgi:hypothetical protein